MCARSPLSIAATAAALLLPLLAAPHPASSQALDVYPTDRCVALKLRAAGQYCAATLQAAGLPGQGARDGRLAVARALLAYGWEAIEAAAERAGVSCSETTVTADEMQALLDAAADDFVASLGAGPPGCTTHRAALAAQTCRQLLALEGQHLMLRSIDRTRRALETRRARALVPLEQAWDAGACQSGPSVEEGVALLEDVVEEAKLAAVVSPAVTHEWMKIDPPDQVQYGDRVLEPICSRGTPWHFYARRGTVNKVLVYYQGGGACWNFLTCSEFFPVFKERVTDGDDPSNFRSGFADLDDPNNPFRDWHAVFVPYCTGDVHWGDAVVDHEMSGQTTTIHHKGFVNAQVAEKWAREHFVNPDQVFVTGSSAGSYGAIVNALPLQEFAWPSTEFVVLGDGGNGVITNEFLQNDLAKWGIEKNLPRWIPGLDRPITELDAADLWTEAALFYPDSRWANYTTAYDGGTGGQVGFYNIMKSGQDLTQWIQWWRPSCEWNQIMRSLVQDTAARAPNYRYYIGSGSRHTMWNNDKVYTDTTGGVPTIRSWVEAMLAGSPDWVNVQCEDCGVLLPGDPRPDPLQPPYQLDPVTNQARVVCEE